MRGLSMWNRFLLGLALAGLAAGGLAAAAGRPGLGPDIWMIVTAGMLLALLVQSMANLVRGKLGVDLVAALAMGGALLLDQQLAGAVIAVMLAGGGALEEYAQARSRRELSALLDRVPRRAHRIDGDSLTDIDIGQIVPNDRLLVKAGEIVPVDGILTAAAVLDESALTGEALPVNRPAGDRVSSGVVNGGDAFAMVALAAAADSTYAAVIRLVEDAAKTKAPFVRLADRFALIFIPVTMAIAGVAWGASGDPIRGLAVLVVATPCPLILAAPVAIIAGISRAAHLGILIKSGGALETLARARTLLLDKTGTVTGGNARLVAVEPIGTVPESELLRLAASLDQASQHITAVAVTNAARARGFALALPADVHEQPGAGIAGIVDGRRVAVGSLDWLRGQATVPAAGAVLERRLGRRGLSGVFVAIDGIVAGALMLADEIRRDAAAALRRLRRAGIRRVVMVSGDRAGIAQAIGFALGLDGVLSECQPGDKVSAVEAERRAAVTIMVGDGINDAPALAAADVGVALGARGAAAASQAADVVVLVDRLDRLADAMTIARRSRRLAMQSVVAGMAFSVAAMFLAAFGALGPIAGAVVQEVIDVLVVLNALRALGHDGRGRARHGLTPAATSELTAQHAALADVLTRLRQVADRLETLPPERAVKELAALEAMLRERVLPHEQADDDTLYPRLAGLLEGQDPLASMSRTHREIRQLVSLLGRLVADLDPGRFDGEDLREARRLLYGLEAILSLHVAQEEEIFYALRSVEDK